MAQTVFTKKVVNEIVNYLKEIGKEGIIFSNELHLQMHLAQFLQKKCYDIEYEYQVPTDRLKDVEKKDVYPWKKINGQPQEMYLDLVVCGKNREEYFPIEIKYKTRSLTTKTENEETYIFNRIEKGVNRLRNQGAQDLGMYGFWKDVHRVELVKKTYPAVKNGLVIFITNDPYYQKNDSKPTVNYYDFRMTDGRNVVSSTLGWVNENSQVVKKYPAFKLDGKYKICWHHIGEHSNLRDRDCFSYCMVLV